MNIMTINPGIKLVCFDLDGTRADTEPLHDRVKRRLIAQLGYTAPVDYAALVGKPSRNLWEPMLAALGRTDETARSMEEKQLSMISQLAREERLPASAGLCELLHELRARNIPAAVCTSSFRFYADEMIENLGLSGVFDFVIGGDEVANSKPAPDIYRAALAHFGVEGRDALAIEDSAAGVAAAIAAGVPCIGYKNPTSGDQDLSAADWIVDSLEEIKL
jgi:HAD superfamily hydrolase (TIGR01509 family)